MANKKLQFILIALLSFSFLPQALRAGEGDILWKTNFGGARNDNFAAVTAVADGMVVVGHSDFASFGSGDWKDVPGKGEIDAVIVKYDNNGNVVWKNNFGGLGSDYFESVAALPDGVIAVGYSEFTSFGNGDWETFERKGLQDAIMVKYDNDGNVVWKQNFGGTATGYSRYFSVIVIADEIIAAGYSDGFGAGDWEEFTGNGNEDAIIVKYDHEGNLIWKNYFGGKDVDRFFSVTAATNGFVAAGVSFAASFENGDWATDTCKGAKDAIMVKFDNDGNIIWQTNFGGNGDDIYYSVTTLPDGFVTVGLSFPNSFGTGDWASDTCKGWEDAIMVMYDTVGNLQWKRSFGGNGGDCFNAVTALPDAIVAVGSSDSFGFGDWTNITGKGSNDAIIVAFDHAGNVKWKRNFGGTDLDTYNAVTLASNTLVAAGYSNFNSFKTGDWNDMEGNGWEDAVMVRYSAGIVGIAEPKQEPAKITVYPNPTTGELRITNYELQITSIEVFDVYGRKQKAENRKQNLIDISHLQTGLYFVKITTEAGEVIRKVVKE